ncbi:uncharacterized protein YALI1_B20359g [Yarrowia lipolytica]|uniref:Uncharacterized protein n=1 Tax=Yarrowia lipolytica TaxID=4952 RepID=A0A1D8N7Y1_YARLL|nr:hypothetical protein YALI1_B20359g [Yarrowia lipolytica]
MFCSQSSKHTVSSHGTILGCISTVLYCFIALSYQCTASKCLEHVLKLKHSMYSVGSQIEPGTYVQPSTQKLSFYGSSGRCLGCLNLVRACDEHCSCTISTSVPGTPCTRLMSCTWIYYALYRIYIPVLNCQEVQYDWADEPLVVVRFTQPEKTLTPRAGTHSSRGLIWDLMTQEPCDSYCTGPRMLFSIIPHFGELKTPQTRDVPHPCMAAPITCSDFL